MSKIKFRPLRDRVVIARKDTEEKSPGGIIIPETAKERPNEGVVVAAGRGKITAEGRLIEMSVKPGDKVLFGKWQGSDVKLDGKELVIVSEEDVLGVLED